MRHKYTKNINNVYSGLRGLQLDFSSLSSELLVMSVIGSRMKKKTKKAMSRNREKLYKLLLLWPYGRTDQCLSKAVREVGPTSLLDCPLLLSHGCLAMC